MFAKWIFNAENNRSVKYVCKHDFQFEFKCQVQFKSHNADRCILDVFHFSSVLKTITIHPRAPIHFSHISTIRIQFPILQFSPKPIERIDAQNRFDACMHAYAMELECSLPVVNVV